MNNLVIGIGDLHGHYRALERILEALQEKCGIFRESSPDRLLEGYDEAVELLRGSSAGRRRGAVAAYGRLGNTV